MAKRKKTSDIDLADLTVLFLDCQTSGATPDNGTIIELGWMRSGPRARLRSFVIRPEDDQPVPGRILSITGIGEEELLSGNPVDEVWNRLLSESQTVAQQQHMTACPAVVHYARFEKVFLNALHVKTGEDQPFPFQMICTHAIARRLFPELPRKGIRAIAGYLGQSLGEHRRSREHVLSTRFIWQAMLPLLEEKHQIRTLNELLDWLQTKISSRTKNRSYPMEDELRLSLPKAPGVYRMLRSNRDILYIGKATSLRQRVNSYFQKKSFHPEHILEMLSQAKGLDVTPTGSALEAALLETDEIKRFSPPYNRALRKKQRKIWFTNTDFSDWQESPDRLFRLGPFISELPIQSLFGVWMLLNTIDRTESMNHEVLGLPEGYMPEDLDLIRAGFDLFCNDWAKSLTRKSFFSGVIQVGRELWLKRLAEKEAAEGVETDEDEGEMETMEVVWTPEAVARVLERHIRWGAYAMRRSRWFTLLTDSTLAWVPPETAPSTRILVFQAGRIIRSNQMGRTPHIPAPPGYRRGRINRLACFDVETWDRMRVLTTEIRSLVNQGMELSVRLGPNTLLGTAELRKLFKWI